MPLLSLQDLEVVFPGRKGRADVRAVDGVSFDVEAGEAVGLVGESGCGKTVTALATLGLLPADHARVSGSVVFDGRSWRELPVRSLRSRRGRQAAIVFQDPMTALNPVLTVGRQVAEVLEQHFRTPRREAHRQAVALLDRVGLPDPRRRARSFPHQLSGGMRQRVAIAMAIAGRPRLLVADEPTTALDVTVQAQILELLRGLTAESGMALLLITHDLGVVAGTCATVHVMYAGRVVESAPRGAIFGQPRHPYTAGLLASIPRVDRLAGERLSVIPGSPRDVVAWSRGCAFAPRCGNEVEGCRAGPPALVGDGAGSRRQVRCLNPVGAPAPAE